MGYGYSYDHNSSYGSNYTRKRGYFENDILKFGKYKNFKLENVPESYLKWAKNEFGNPSSYWVKRGFKPEPHVAVRMQKEIERRAEDDAKAKAIEQAETEQAIIDKFVEENGLAKYLNKKNTKFNIGDWVVVKKYAKRKGIVKEEASIGEVTFVGIDNDKPYYHVDTGIAISSGVYNDKELKMWTEKSSIFTTGSILLLWAIFLFSPVPVFTYISLTMGK